MLESLLRVHRTDFEEIFTEFFGTANIDIYSTICDDYRSSPAYFNDKISIIKVILKDGKSYEELFNKLLLYISHYTGSESIPERIRIKKAKKQFMRYSNLTATTDLNTISRYREIWEFILYFLTESVLWYPMLISKMKFKTNTTMPLNWADGIHIGVDAGGKLQIYMGEAKICNSLDNAKTQAKDSLSTSLSPEVMLNTDLNLIWRNQYDWNIWDNTELRAKLEQLINPFFEEDEQVEQFNFDIVCLLGYECDHYKKNIDKLISDADYLNEVEKKLKSIFRTFKNISSLWDRKIQFFLLPLFNHEDLIRWFLTHLNNE